MASVASLYLESTVCNIGIKHLLFLTIGRGLPRHLNSYPWVLLDVKLRFVSSLVLVVIRTFWPRPSPLIRFIDAGQSLIMCRLVSERCRYKLVSEGRVIPHSVSLFNVLQVSRIKVFQHILWDISVNWLLHNSKLGVMFSAFILSIRIICAFLTRHIQNSLFNLAPPTAYHWRFFIDVITTTRSLARRWVAWLMSWWLFIIVHALLLWAIMFSKGWVGLDLQCLFCPRSPLLMLPTWSSSSSWSLSRFITSTRPLNAGRLLLRRILYRLRHIPSRSWRFKDWLGYKSCLRRAYHCRCMLLRVYTLLLHASHHLILLLL